MSLQPQTFYLIPTETALVAHTAFPKGNVYLRIADTLGTIFTDQQFAPLFAVQGQAALSPVRLALTTILQYAEGLSDRQAADAVRARIDWKYLLCLDLTDPGFDASVLSEFRARLLTHELTDLLFDTLLQQCRERGLLRQRGQQRTDSTHILAAVRTLNRLERVGETMRAALNSLAVIDPDWLQLHTPTAWYDRYGSPVDNYRLPKTDTARAALAAVIGQDGRDLLQWIDHPDAPAYLATIPAITMLRRVWQEQYTDPPDPIAWRSVRELASSAERIASPYDPDARWSTKQGMEWTGYKVHLTETCDPDQPNLIVNVQTTPATQPDDTTMATIHAGLASQDRLPGVHFVDAGYTSAAVIIAGRDQYDIEVVGPMARDPSWQAKANQGFDLGAFQVDWESQHVICPMGQQSCNWKEGKARDGSPIIQVQWAHGACRRCPMRQHCTHSQTQPRHITLNVQRHHTTIQAARKQQHTPEFKARYAQRAGIEGTHAQAIARNDLRHARYIGLAKTHLQALASATALNLVRMSAWLAGTPKATTYISRFAQLQMSAPRAAP